MTAESWQTERTREGEASYVQALVKSSSVNLWVALIFVMMLAGASVPISIIALLAANRNHVAVDGAPGPTGTQGAAGRDGFNGTDGLNGAPGLNGANGVNGSTLATELALDAFRGVKASDVLTMRMYDDTPGFPSVILIGPSSSTSTLAVRASGVGIGVSTLTTNVALEVNQNLGALLLPRFTTAQRHALAVPAGSLVYDTNLQAVCVYASTAQWYTLTMTSAP